MTAVRKAKKLNQLKKSGGRRKAADKKKLPAADEGAPAEKQAEYHSHTRQARSLEIAEDYVEVIALLIDSDGEARVVDLARRLGVTHVTVIRTIERLQRAGLVTSKPYRSIFLTDSGRKLADRVRKRHELVVQFLLALGVDAETARIDAEGIEHHVSAQTLAAFGRLVEKYR